MRAFHEPSDTRSRSDPVALGGSAIEAVALAMMLLRSWSICLFSMAPLVAAAATAPPSTSIKTVQITSGKTEHADIRNISAAKLQCLPPNFYTILQLILPATNCKHKNVIRVALSTEVQFFETHQRLM